MAACAQCGSAVPRGANSCPQCGAAVMRVAKRAAAGPRATAVPAVKPVVKAVAEPVSPRVKGGAAPAKAVPKVTPKRVPDAPAAAARATTRRRAQRAPEPPAEAAPAATPPASRRRTAPDSAVPATSRRRATAAAPADAPAAPAAPARRRRSAEELAAAYDTPAATPVGAPAPDPEPTDPAPEAAPAAAAPAFTRSRRPTGDVIGDADERSPHDPVVVEPEGRASLPAPFEVVYDADDRRARWPLALRVARGSWLPALWTSLPALATTVVVAAVAAASLFLATKPEGDDLLAGDLTAGRWVRYVCAAVGMAFGAPLRVEQERAGRAAELGFEFGYVVRFVPLTVTLLSLAALWVFARRAHERNVTPERLPDAIRAAAVYAAGVGLVAWFGRWQVEAQPDDDDVFGITKLAFSTSPWRPMFWAFCAALLVAWLATGQVVVAGRSAGWLLAARGALVGLGAGSAVSFLLLVVLGIAYADRAGAEATDVMNALPLMLAYGVGAAAAAFGVLSGGQFLLPVRDTGRWSLLAPWLPKPFLLLLVVPALSVAFGAWYLLRRSGAPREEALRACARMGLPAAAVWLVVCAVGSPRAGQDFGGVSAAATVGPVLWGALLVALWFGVGGWAAGRLLDRRYPAPAEPEQPFDPPVAAT